MVSEKYHAQMKEAQQVVAEKTSALEAEAYKTKRLHVRLLLLSFDLFVWVNCNFLYFIHRRSWLYYDVKQKG